MPHRLLRRQASFSTGCKINFAIPRNAFLLPPSALLHSIMMATLTFEALLSSNFA